MILDILALTCIAVGASLIGGFIGAHAVVAYMRYLQALYKGVHEDGERIHHRINR